MFKLARFREIRHQLPPDAFVNRSYTEFHEEDWINVDADPSLGTSIVPLDHCNPVMIFSFSYFAEERRVCYDQGHDALLL